MSAPGLHTRGKSLRPYLVLAALSVAAYLIYNYLKKMITSNNSGIVYDLLLRSGLNDTLSKFATAQAGHETNGFTSAIFKSNNNAFGMRYAGQVNSKGDKNGYADYEGVNNSVSDFVAWYSRHRNSIFSLPLYINSLASYVRFLKNNNYFEADEAAYLKGCQYFYNQIFDA